mgnify:CR=1 FL=1
MLDAFAPLLDEWQGAGTFVGKPATARYRVERALNGRFILLRYEALDAEGRVVFEGHGYYKAGGAGTWQDSQGNLYPVTWTGTGQGVNTEWNNGAGASQYQREGEEFTVTDRARGKVFASFRLRRK